MLLEKLVAAGIGNQPVVFVTHRLVWLLESIHISCLHRRLAIALIGLLFHFYDWHASFEVEAHDFHFGHRSKTEYIEFNSKRLTNSCLKIKLGGHTILQITLFKYLGSII